MGVGDGEGKEREGRTNEKSDEGMRGIPCKDFKKSGRKGCYE